MRVLFFILLLFPIATVAQTCRVKLIDYNENKTPAYCGYQITYGILKLELQEAAGSLKKGDTIFLFQKCPRELMEEKIGKYQNKQTYSLSLGRKGIDDLLLQEKAKDIAKKEYPNDKPQEFWYGYIMSVK